MDELAVHEDEEDELVSHGASISQKIIASAMTMGSVLSWVQSYHWKHTRNRNEAMVLGQAIDAFMKGGVPLAHLGMEILSRRLAGLHFADLNDNWDYCTAIQLPTVAHSLLPQSDMNDVIRSAAAISRLKSSVRPKRGHYRGGRSGGHNGGYNGGHNGYNGGGWRGGRGRGGSGGSNRGGFHRGGGGRGSHSQSDSRTGDGAGAQSQ